MNEKAVKDRLRENRAAITGALIAANVGNPYAAEPDRERRVNRLQAKARLSHKEASAIDGQIEKTRSTAERGKSITPDELEETATSGPSMSAAPSPTAAEKVWGDTVDFVNVSFLEKGARIARAVGRVSFRNGKAQGTGFLIGEGLYLTNHHVVPSPEFASRLMLQFDYETDLTGSHKAPTSFSIDTTIFLTSDDSKDGLDYSLFAVGPRLEGERPLEIFGWSGLSDASDKHMLGEFANIVQHPRGRFKEVVLRENRLVSRAESTLHYVADTLPGSSGSPVFNSEWRPIALHHWGGPWADIFDNDGDEIDLKVNEGIRISSIVGDIRKQVQHLNPTARERIQRALFQGGQAEASGDLFVPDYCALKSADGMMAPTISQNGRLNWTIPVEISVGIPALAGTNAIPGAAPTAIPSADDIGEPTEAQPAEPAAKQRPRRTKPSTGKTKKP